MAGVLAVGPVARVMNRRGPMLARSAHMAGSAVQTRVATQTIRRLRIFVLPFHENHWMFLHKLEIFLEAGKGLLTGQGSDPQLMISISRDGGKTWGAELWVSAGALGAYRYRSMLRRLGRYRNGAVKIVVSDPVAWNLVAAFGDITGP